MFSRLPKKLLSIFFFLLVVFAEAFYILNAQNFVDTQIRDIINTKPERLYLDFKRTRTNWIPGWVEVEDFTIKGHDGSVRWFVGVKNVQGFIFLPTLFFRRLSVLHVRGSGGEVVIDLFQEKPFKAHPPLAAAINKLNKKPPFRLSFKNIKIQDYEKIKIHDYSFQGRANIKGGFELWPGRLLNIDGGRVEFLEGPIYKAENIFIEKPWGHVMADVVDYDVKNDNLQQLFRKTSAQALVEGVTQKSDLINSYLSGIPWLHLDYFSGYFNGRIFIHKGRLSSPTSLKINLSNLQAKLGNYKGEGRGDLIWSVQKEKAAQYGEDLKMQIDLGPFKFFDRLEKEVAVSGQKLSVNADTENLMVYDVFSDLKDLRLKLDFSKSKIHDLSVLNDFIPTAKNFLINSGEADLEAVVHVSTKESAPNSFVRISSSNTRASYKSIKFSGDSHLEISFIDNEPGLAEFLIEKGELKFFNVRVLNTLAYPKRELTGWAAELQTQQAKFSPDRPVVAEGQVEFRMDNLEPLLVVLASESKFFSFLKKVTAIKNISGSCGYHFGRGLVDVNNVVFKSSDLSAEGRLRFLGDEKKVVAWIKYETLQAGIDYSSKKKSYRFQKSYEWYQGRPAWPSIQEDLENQNSKVQEYPKKNQ